MAKSALIHLYQMNKYDIPAKYAKKLKILLRESSNTLQQKKGG
jgi:hypothetical protein